MPYGPCRLCGRTNYANSLGGPYICPSCDCGNPPQRGTPAYYTAQEPAPLFMPLLPIVVPEPHRMSYAEYEADPKAAWDKTLEGRDVWVELPDGRTMLLSGRSDVPGSWDEPGAFEPV